MQHAGIEAEIAAQLVKEVVQHTAIAAVTIDDCQIARRQGARDVARELAQQRDEGLDGERQRSRRPIVLARERDRDGRKLP